MSENPEKLKRHSFIQREASDDSGESVSLSILSHLYCGHYLPNIQPLDEDRKFHGIVFQKLVSINFLDKMQRERT